MATEEQIELSNLIKTVHQTLRETAKETDAQTAWRSHLENEEILKTYSDAMHKLACYWDSNMDQNDKKENCRNNWIVTTCKNYFFNVNVLEFYREKERKIMVPSDDIAEPEIKDKIRLLDVGSCYNPLAKYPIFEVTAIDIAPAADSVLYCDFLDVPVTDIVGVIDDKVIGLPASYYDVVVFCLLLEYLPTSEQRMECCQKAYDLLNDEGLLLIITPDSKHQGANAKLMKNWRYTLGLMGFIRIKIEKLEHITCMAFRKSIHKEVAIRWSRLHKESYMEESLNIPQDFNTIDEPESSISTTLQSTESIPGMFEEFLLPSLKEEED